MELIFDGHRLKTSVHERPNGNAVIRFRIDKDKKQWATSAEVPRKKQVTRDVLIARVGSWWKDNASRLKPAPIASAAAPALDLVKEINRFMAEEYRYQVADHTAQVRTVLLEMAALVPGAEVQDITRKVFRETIKPAMSSGAAKTWANKRGYIKAFFRWETEQEDEAGNPHLEKDPTLGDKAPSSDLFGTHEETWELDESVFSQVLDKVNGDTRLTKADRPLFRAALEDLWFTGMDFKDLWQLEPHKDIIEVRVTGRDGALKSGAKIYKKRSKESEIIDQPIDSAIRPRWVMAKEAAKPGDLLHAWARRYSTPKSWGNQVRNAAQRAREALGLPWRDVKSIRHTFETRWARVYVESRGLRGPNREELNKWMGRARGSNVGQKVYDKNKAWVDPDTV